MTKKQEEQHSQTSEELSKKVEELTAQVADLDVKLKSALADYQNMRREQETQQELREGIIKKLVFADLIDLFSDLHYAVEQLNPEMKSNSQISGIIMIMSKYQDLLRNHGVSEITFKEGDEYDASIAEVLSVVAHPDMDNKVAQMIQPGYKIGDVLIKPAKVMMYRKSIVR